MENSEDMGCMLDTAKSIPIETILGYPVSKEVMSGRVKKYSSPFSSDSVPSFAIYPGNRYYDFSTGMYGDSIQLIMELKDVSFSEALTLLNGYEPMALPQHPSKPKKEFVFDHYIATRSSDKNKIKKYANSRGIKSGYFFGIFYTKDDGKWVHHPSLGFKHLDYNKKVIGVKLRPLPKDPYRERFSARGKLGLYICENIIDDSWLDPVLYVVEGETNANSLWEYCKLRNINAVVVSGGGVTDPPKFIPKQYEAYERRIIIDYDGSEPKYRQRCKLYDHLNGKHIKLILPKGEDINSLWSSGKADLISNLIL